MKFKIIFVNYIQNHIIQLHSKSYHSMKFKIISFNEIRNHIFQWNFNIIIIYKTALYLAVEKENIEIVKLLLTNDKLDMNIINILNLFFIKLKMIFFNFIQNHIFQWYSKSYLSMIFKIISFNEIQNHIFQYNSKSYLSITFKIISFNRIQNHIFQWNFNIIIIYKTALYLAVEKENIEIIKLLLTNDKLDINIINILNIFFYKISNHIFQWNSKSYLSI